MHFHPSKKIILFLILLISENTYSQMPDWRYFRDREGNGYYLDRGGGIRITGKPVYRYKPVSGEGIDYYINLGKELVKDRHLLEGLIVLKSILAMPAVNERIRKAQVKAAGEIMQMKKRGGARFDALNRKASLSLYREGKEIMIINDLMYYSVRSSRKVDIVRQRLREKPDYIYCGVLLGFRNWEENDGNKKKGYDFLAAIDSERYGRDIKNLDLAVKNWRVKLGGDSLKRSTVKKTVDFVIYRFYSRGKPAYSGYEGIYYNGIFSYIIRIIVPGKNFQRLNGPMLKLLQTFRIVKK